MSYEYRRRIRYVNTKIWILIYNIPIVRDFIWTAFKLLIPRILISQPHPLWIGLHDEGAFYVIRWNHVMHQEVYHSFPELEYGIFQTFTCKRDCLYIVNEVGRRGNGWDRHWLCWISSTGRKKSQDSQDFFTFKSFTLSRMCCPGDKSMGEVNPSRSPQSVSWWLCVFSYAWGHAWLWNDDEALYLHVVRQLIAEEATLVANTNDFKCVADIWCHSVL